MTWREKRKNLFITIIILIIISFLAYKIYPYFNVAPTCVDKKQNGNERGIDCGGSCRTVCPLDVLPFEVKFSRILKVEDNIYDIVALVDNKNSDKNIVDGNIDYIFNVYDKAGEIVKTITSSTTIPLGQVFPIILQNVNINFGNSGNDVNKVTLNILNNKSWQVENSIYANNFFKVISKDFIQNKNNISQLTVSVKNVSKVNFINVPVKVILYNKDGNIIAVNDSFLESIDSGNSKDVIFTWRTPLDISDPKIDVYTIVTPYTVIKS